MTISRNGSFFEDQTTGEHVYGAAEFGDGQGSLAIHEGSIVEMGHSEGVDELYFHVGIGDYTYQSAYGAVSVTGSLTPGSISALDGVSSGKLAVVIGSFYGKGQVEYKTNSSGTFTASDSMIVSLGLLRGEGKISVTDSSAVGFVSEAGTTEFLIGVGGYGLSLSYDTKGSVLLARSSSLQLYSELSTSFVVGAAGAALGSVIVKDSELSVAASGSGSSAEFIVARDGADGIVSFENADVTIGGEGSAATVSFGVSSKNSKGTMDVIDSRVTVVGDSALVELNGSSRRTSELTVSEGSVLQVGTTATESAATSAAVGNLSIGESGRGLLKIEGHETLVAAGYGVTIGGEELGHSGSLLLDGGTIEAGVFFEVGRNGSVTSYGGALSVGDGEFDLLIGGGRLALFGGETLIEASLLLNQSAQLTFGSHSLNGTDAPLLHRGERLSLDETSQLTVVQYGQDISAGTTRHLIETSATHAAIDVELEQLMVLGQADDFGYVFNLVESAREGFHDYSFTALNAGSGNGTALLDFGEQNTAAVYSSRLLEDGRTGGKGEGGTLGSFAAFNVEAIAGTNEDDLFRLGGGELRAYGRGGGDFVEGNSADNLFFGGDGADELVGASGDDTLHGDDGNDVLRGGTGNDRLFGGDQNDILFGDGGADLLNGGRGFDYVSYTASDSGITIDVRNASVNDGDASGDRLQLIENLVGSQFADTVLGGDVANELLGRAGDDVIDGRGGADLIDGGAGADLLIGGQGFDTFRYQLAGESRIASQDTIKDFDRDFDVIDLSRIDADVATSGDQAFLFIGASAFSGVAGELRYGRAVDRVTIAADTDGDGRADLAVKLDDISVLTSADFIL